MNCSKNLLDSLYHIHMTQNVPGEFYKQFALRFIYFLFYSVFHQLQIFSLFICFTTSSLPSLTSFRIQPFLCTQIIFICIPLFCCLLAPNLLSVYVRLCYKKGSKEKKICITYKNMKNNHTQTHTQIR